MEQFVITIKDTNKKKFFFELLNNLDFIEFEEKPISKLKMELKKSVDEINNLKTKTKNIPSFNDLLNEL